MMTEQIMMSYDHFQALFWLMAAMFLHMNVSFRRGHSSAAKTSFQSCPVATRGFAVKQFPISFFGRPY